jgi:uncharacterized protein YidB (DUF937 family)
MGLLDVLNSIQGGGASSDPRAQSAQAGMSPMAKALLALLAVYAAKNLRQADAPSTQPAQPRPTGRGASAGPSPGTGGLPGGDLGDLLRGTLGGLLGGAGAGTVLNGGLGGLLKQLQESGQGEVAKSWVGTGPNKQISEGDLADALGANTLNEVSRQSGVDRRDLLSGLGQYLPRFVDQLTPDGRVPSEEEASRMV